MDPGLQELILSDDLEQETEAIVKLKDANTLPEKANIVARFGEIATCRLKVKHITDVWSDEAVYSLKAARYVSFDPEPESSEIPELDSESFPRYERRPESPFTGKGVAVGVVDWGFDFSHPNFLLPDSSTRFLALWDQSAPFHESAAKYGYGRVYGKEEINAALKTDSPFEALGYHPSKGDPMNDGAHGTHVLDIAAGNGHIGQSGIAPGADIIAVHLSAGNIGGLASLGDSVRILEAIDFIGEVTEEMPVVINMSVGKHGGSHDGSSLVEQGMDAFLKQKSGRCIVQSAGNYYRSQTHCSGRVLPGGTRQLNWYVDLYDKTPNELEVWYSGKDRFSVAIKPPADKLEIRASLRERGDIIIGNELVGRLYHRAFEPNSGNHHIDIFLYRNAPPGKWEISLYGEDVVDGRWHAWIERDGSCKGCQSRFDAEDADPTTTTGTICNGLYSIAVGAVNPYSNTLAIAPFSSSGPTADGRQKPNLTAPGILIEAARSAPFNEMRSRGQLISKSGTSMAAPHVTGAVATLFEAVGEPLPINTTRRYLLSNVETLVGLSEEEAVRVGTGYLSLDTMLGNVLQAHSKDSVLPKNKFTMKYHTIESGSKHQVEAEASLENAVLDEGLVGKEEQDFSHQNNSRDEELADGWHGSDDPEEWEYAGEEEINDGFEGDLEDEEINDTLESDTEVQKMSLEAIDFPYFGKGDGLFELNEKDDNEDDYDQNHIDSHHYFLHENCRMCQKEALLTAEKQMEQLPFGSNDLLDIFEPSRTIGNHAGYAMPKIRSSSVFDKAVHRKGFNHIEKVDYQVIGFPGEKLIDALQSGDILLRRALGEGDLSFQSMVVEDDLSGPSRIEDRKGESGLPGSYVQVIEMVPIPIRIADQFYRRLLDENGRILPYQMIIRIKPRAEGSFGLSFDSKDLALEEASTRISFSVRNRLLTNRGVRSCRIELSGSGGTLAGTANSWGDLRLDISSLADGTYTLSAMPPNTSTLPVGPALAGNTNPPDAIWRPLRVSVEKDNNRLTSTDPNVEISGNKFRIKLQPVWLHSPNQSHRPPGETLDLIIIHHTAGPRIGPALNHFLNGSGSNRASAHYIIDTDGQVIKMVPESRKSWHAGISHWGGRNSVNNFSIGIEIVHSNGHYPAIQYQALQDLLLGIRAAHTNIPSERIVGHSDIALIQNRTRLGRKAGDPGSNFEWTRLEAAGLGLVVALGPIDLRNSYGGFFELYPNSSLRQGDRDDHRRFGGQRRPGITTVVIRELQTDLRGIGYFCPLNGRFDNATMWSVRTFQEHFFTGNRSTIAFVRGRVNSWTATFIKSLAP